ncbi:hypothetical protein [Acanthopleuribacter pedis]|uniref:Uncharacterized protein n=1 Tax=Acanthopleuribacter pedis TaxID=442870 RepID=A0A8J7QDL4_9BACT|nr:hypothetical protein [Acanthopleuribacter pedis]MBO1317660.1 hypothetical protein [Acanthopleuribacter pedis]
MDKHNELIGIRPAKPKVSSRVSQKADKARKHTKTKRSQTKQSTTKKALPNSNAKVIAPEPAQTTNLLLPAN